jgi:hypothetical protein
MQEISTHYPGNIKKAYNVKERHGGSVKENSISK